MSRSQDDQEPREDVLAVKGTDRTLDSTSFARMNEIRERYEEAWQAALSGAPEPRIETYLSLGSDEERPLLSVQLQEVQRTYRQRISTHASAADGNTAVFTSPPTTKEPPAEPDRKPNLQVTAASAPGAEGELDSKFVLPPTPPPVRVTGYEILGRIGHGGMGVVYKARHVRLDRTEALKMVLGGAHASPDQLVRFRAEAQAAAQLQHPNIVQVHEVGEVDGLPFFSLEYVDGGSLAQKLGGQPQPPREAAHLALTLAGAMEYAHKHGVLHRDLKPSNILLSADGVPKITDFGLAKRLEADSTQTRSGTILGTPSYMAPEQARGEMKETGRTTDVYGLGTILYESLTGRAPFVAATQMETLKLVIGQEPVPPSRLRPGVPVDLETICLKCLQKEQLKRYPTAGALARDLSHFLAGEPIEARPVGPAERFWRLCRRNPGVTTMLATIFALMATVAVTSTVLLVRISREKAQTEIERKAAEEARDLAQKNEITARKAETLAAANAKLAAERADAASAAQRKAEEEQKKADKARRAAAASAEDAGRQRALALDTLNTLVTQVQDQLQDTPDTHRLKQTLLQTALNGLQILAQDSEQSSAVDVYMAEAHRRMGDLYQILGKILEARDQYQKMHRITRALLDQDELSDLYLRSESIALAMIGDTYLYVNDRVRAREEYEKSLAIRRKLAEADRANSIRQVDLAQIYTKLGDACPPAEARKYFAEALALREKLTDGATDQEAQNRKRDVWVSRLRLANLALQVRDFEDSRQHAAACVKLAGEMVAKASTFRTRLDQAISLCKYGLVLRRSGKHAEADRHFAVSLKLFKILADLDPQNLALQDEYTQALAHAGRHAEAAAAADRLRGRVGNNPNFLYNLACSYAECEGAAGPPAGAAAGAAAATRLGYEERALAALRDAVKAGFKNVDLARTDPDLDSIRDRPEFGAILAAIPAAKPEKGK